MIDARNEAAALHHRRIETLRQHACRPVAEAHVEQGHAKGRFRTAYLAQAARKGVASQGNTAGMLAAFYSVPASLFRIYRGVLSDQYGARRVMYWTFGVSVVCLFLLSYPATD